MNNRLPSFFLWMSLLGMSVVAVNAQETDKITTRHIHPDVRKMTLLVIEYELGDSTDGDFGRHKVSKEETEEYLEKVNDNRYKLNIQLEKNMQRYHYNYRIIPRKDLDYFDDLEKYRYVLDRNLVKVVSNKKYGQFLDRYTYTYFVKDRKTGRNFSDINLYYSDPNKSEKVIILELNDFLEEYELREQEKALNSSGAEGQ